MRGPVEWFEGDGEAADRALLVPGAFTAARSFEPLAAELAERGLTTGVVRLPARSARIPQLDLGGIEAIDRTLDEAAGGLGEEAVLIGHSLGAVAAIRLARRRPVRAVVLLMPPPVGGAARTLLAMLRRDPASAAKFLALAGTAEAVRRFPGDPPAGLFSAEATDEEIEASSGLRASESWRVLAELLVGVDVGEGHLDAPALCVAGSLDTLAPVAEVAKLADRLGADYIEHEVGHGFNEEAAGRKLVRRSVERWLDGALRS